MASRSEHTGPACTANRSFLSRWLCSLLQCRRQCSWQWDCQIRPEVIDCLLLPLLNRCPVQDQSGTCRTCWNVLGHNCSCFQNSDEMCGMGCFCISALILSVKLSPQPSSSVSYLHAAATSELIPLSEDERFLRCLFRSMRLLDGSLGLRLDDRQHTFNPRPFFLNYLVRRIGCVLDRFNTDLNGSLVGLRQLLNHEFESVKTFPSG